jgi:hypothetical protein
MQVHDSHGLEKNLRCMLCKGSKDKLVKLSDDAVLQKMLALVMTHRPVCPTDSLQASLS